MKLLVALFLVGAFTDAVLTDTTATTVHIESAHQTKSDQLTGSGNLPTIAQQTNCAGSLTKITGTLLGDEYADFYQIRVMAGTPLQIDTETNGDPMLSLYSTDSLGVIIDDDGARDGNGNQASIYVPDPTTALYYIAIHRYGTNIHDCQGRNIFSDADRDDDGGSGNSGTGSANPICSLTTPPGDDDWDDDYSPPPGDDDDAYVFDDNMFEHIGDDDMPYRIIVTAGDVTCTEAPTNDSPTEAPTGMATMMMGPPSHPCASLGENDCSTRSSCPWQPPPNDCPYLCQWVRGECFPNLGP